MLINSYAIRAQDNWIRRDCRYSHQAYQRFDREALFSKYTWGKMEGFKDYQRLFGTTRGQIPRRRPHRHPRSLARRSHHPSCPCQETRLLRKTHFAYHQGRTSHGRCGQGERSRFQTGSQQRSEYGGKFRRTVEMVRSGAIGELKRFESAWVDHPNPAIFQLNPHQKALTGMPGLDRHPHADSTKFFARMAFTTTSLPGVRYREYCNGQLADMGAHHFDIGQWAMDADNTGPVKVIPPKDGERDLKMIYANGVEVVHGNTPDWRGGTIFYGTEGTIWVDRGPWKSDPENLIKEYKATVSLRQPKNHHDDWLDCIHSGKLPLAHAEAGHRTATLCQLCNIGYELRRELNWDPKKEVFVNDDEANKLTDRKRRKKWYRV